MFLKHFPLGLYSTPFPPVITAELYVTLTDYSLKISVSHGILPSIFTFSLRTNLHLQKVKTGLADLVAVVTEEDALVPGNSEADWAF